MPITTGMEAAIAPSRVFATSSAGGRDRFLDIIRTIALLRVTVWHAFGEAAITYVIAAVPTMFFVTGSLLAKSLDRRPWPSVLFERTRRVLIPLWLFGACAFVAMRAAWSIDPSPKTHVPWRSVVFWVLPLGDPKGSAWEGGWLSQPLWYVRAMFWLLLLSPVLRAAVRRVGWLAFVPPLMAVFLLDVLARDPSFTIRAAPDLIWQIGDLALYSTFLMAGFLHREGRFDHLRPAAWGCGGAVAAVASVAWIATQPVPLHVVNNSHPAHLFVGAAWLCVLFACRLPISLLASYRVPSALVDWISQRTMTIYLWHSTAIIVTFQILSRRSSYPFGVYAAAMIGGMVAVTALAVLAFGWIEDIAARRQPRVCPLLVAPGATVAERVRFRQHRRLVERLVGVPALAGLVIASSSAVSSRPRDAELAATNGTVAAAAVASKRPPVPSQAPPKPQFENAPAKPSATTRPADTAPRTAVLAGSTSAGAPDPLAPEADEALRSVLQQLLDDWRVQWDVPGITVGVVVPGRVEWHGASGTDLVTGSEARVGDRFDIGSITKTFTTAIVMQLAREGRIDIDAPLPRLTTVPTFPYDEGITVRHLLSHQSGLVNYRDTPTFAANPDAIDSAAKALIATLKEPLAFAPGTGVGYSSSNYLVLGFLVEQLTGQSFDTLLTTRTFAPANLTTITHSAPRAQAPNFSTSGIVTDTSTLLRWGIALFRDDVVVDRASRDQMWEIDPDVGLGPGTFGYCPCTMDAAGTPRWGWIGHSGGTSELVYSEEDDVAIALNVTDSLWLDDRGRAIAELRERIRTTTLQALTPAWIPPSGDSSEPAPRRS